MYQIFERILVSVHVFLTMSDRRKQGVTTGCRITLKIALRSPASVYQQLYSFSLQAIVVLVV